MGLAYGETDETHAVLADVIDNLLTGQSAANWLHFIVRTALLLAIAAGSNDADLRDRIDQELAISAASATSRLSEDEQ